MTAKAKAPGRTAKRAPRGEPILNRSDIRLILFDLANKLAPDDVEELISRETELRARAAELTAHLPLFRHQVELALDCLHDHVAGTCSQIPYYTISLLAAGVCYFADELDVIPDFLPRVGRLDDAAVMAMACQMAQDGLQRYCEATGRPVELPFGSRTPRRAQPTR